MGFFFCNLFRCENTSSGPDLHSYFSASQELLTRLRQVAIDAGGDPLESYEPWLLMDSLQQCLLQLHQAGYEAPVL